MLYMVLFGMPALFAAGAIWFLADVRERSEVLKRLRKVQADKRRVFQAGLSEEAALGRRIGRKRQPSFGFRR